jgi:hypothetical protein
MWVHAVSFTLSRTRSCSSSPMDRPCHRRRLPSSSCCFLLARHSWADSIRGWEMMRLALRHEKGSFLQKLASMLPVYAKSALVFVMQPAERRLGTSSTYPQEAGRATTEYPVHIADLGFAPCRCTRSARRCSGRRALDVIVEALYDIPSSGLLQVLCLSSQNVVFKCLLRTK